MLFTLDLLAPLTLTSHDNTDKLTKCGLDKYTSEVACKLAERLGSEGWDQYHKVHLEVSQ